MKLIVNLKAEEIGKAITMTFEDVEYEVGDSALFVSDRQQGIHTIIPLANIYTIQSVTDAVFGAGATVEVAS